MLAIRDFVQRQARSQHGGNQRDGKARGLRRQRGRTAGAGIDLDDDVAVVYGVVRPLHVATANNLHGINDAVGFFLQAINGFLCDGLHGGRAERVAGMHAQRVDVLDGAYGDHLAFCIADHFVFQLFPAKDALFNQNLGHRGSRQTARDNGLEFLNVVHQAAARAAHGVGGAQNAGVTQAAGNLDRFFHRVGNFRARHLDAQRIHGVLERLAILAALDGVNLHTNNFHVVFVQHTGFVERGAQVQTGLSAQVGQQRVGALFLDDLRQTFHVQRLNVGDIGRVRVGHDGCGVAVHQHNLVAQRAQRLACLSAGIVEFARLANNDGARTNNQNFMDVGTLTHADSSLDVLSARC